MSGSKLQLKRVERAAYKRDCNTQSKQGLIYSQGQASSVYETPQNAKPTEQ